MRIRFEDDDLRRLYEEPDFVLPRFGPDVTKAYRKTVGALKLANSELDLWKRRSLKLEKLRGDRKGQSSVRINRQWRIIMRVERDVDGRLLVIIELVDYH